MLRKLVAEEPFVGRADELAALSVALDRTLAGNGCVAMLSGEPGIGKTRTAHELERVAGERGMQVLSGRSQEHDGAPPFWPWVQVFRTWLRLHDGDAALDLTRASAGVLLQLLPELSERMAGVQLATPLDPLSGRFRLFDAVSEVLANDARRQPMLLVLDDLHCADGPSLQLLEFLGPNVATAPLCIVGTYREAELRSSRPLQRCLASLTAEPRLLHLPLPGLERPEVARILESRSGQAPSPQLVAALHARSDGNPLFVSELASLLIQQRRQQPASETWEVPIPAGVRELIRRRVAPLSAEAARLVAAAAVLGRQFTLTTLRLVVEPAVAERVEQALAPARDLGIVHPVGRDPETLQFSHALIRETLLEELDDASLVVLHARAARGLEKLYGADAPDHAAELAEHFECARADLGTEQLVTYRIAAGRQAMSRYSYADAVRHFRAALRARGPGHHDLAQAELLARLGATLDQQGETADATRFSELGFAMLLALNLPGPAIELAAERGTSYFVRVTPTTLEGLIAGARQQHLNPAILLSWLALHCAWHGGTRDRLSSVMHDARTALSSVEDRRVSLVVRVALAVCTIVNTDPIDDDELLSIESAARENGDLHLEQRATYLRARFLIEVGRAGEAQVALGHALRIAERLRNSIYVSHALGETITAALQRGAWAVVTAALDRGKELVVGDHRRTAIASGFDWGSAEPDHWSTRSGPIARQGQLALYVGDTDSASRCVSLLTARAADRLVRTQYLAVVPALRLHLNVGDDWDLDVVLAATRRSLANSAAVPAETAGGDVLCLGLCGLLRRDAALVTEATALAAAYPRSFPNPYCTIALPRLLGLMAAFEGDLARARARFAEAVTLCRDHGCLPELAWSCHDYACALLRLGSADDAGPAASLLGEAQEIAGQLGMLPLQARVSELQTSSAAFEVEGLSEREREVVALVCKGFTDREIARFLAIAHKTASNHVANILAKCACANRAELAAYATRQGLDLG